MDTSKSPHQASVAPQHRQCTLLRITGKTSEYYTAWIPEPYVRMKNHVRLFKRGLWEDGWVVVEMGQSLTSKTLEDMVLPRNYFPVDHVAEMPNAQEGDTHVAK